MTDPELMKVVQAYRNHQTYSKEYNQRPEVKARKAAKKELEKEALRVARERGLI